MWGNRNGWIIASVLFLLIAWGAWQAFGINYVTSPTAFGKNPVRLAKMDLEVNPATIVATPDSTDAGPIYRRAIDDVKANRSKYERFVESGKLADAKSLSAIDLVLQATPMNRMTLLMQKPEENIGYFRDAAPEDLLAIELIGKAVESVGMLHWVDKNYSEAGKYFEASFALGAKMYAERVIFMEAYKGIGLMNGAATMLKAIAAIDNDEARVKKLDAFLASTKKTTDLMADMWKVIYAVDEPTIARHAGDIYLFTQADQMQERLWRVESTLKVGRFKYNVGGADGRFADQMGAPIRLAELEKDPDPAVATAARAASALTVQDFRSIK
jgi:hypothetical protein